MDRRTIAAALFLFGCARPDATNEPVVAMPVASVSGTPLPSAEPAALETKTPPHTIAWQADEERGLKEAEQRHVATVISFDAEWCTACRELEQHTFSDRLVRLAMKGVVGVRVDATDDDAPKLSALEEKYRVTGLPTIVFLDASGHEVTRITAFAKPAVFLAALERATSR